MKKVITLLLLLASSATIADTNGTLVGLIRWDAYYTPQSPGGINASVTRALSPAAWNGRAPWWATKDGNTLSIMGTQQTMDAEITYAKNAGLSHWVYLHYGVDDVNSMNNGWRLHQSSTIKNDMKWTLMMQFSDMRSALNATQISTMYVPYFLQANYLKTPTNRPIMDIYFDSTYASQLSANWANSTSNFAAGLAAIKTAANNAGLGDPYFVCDLNGGPSMATLALLGCHQRSDYILGNGTTGIAYPWALMDANIKSLWASQRSGAISAGVDYAPASGMWDTRPRKQNGPPWESTARVPWSGMLVYNVLPTGAEYTAHLTDMVADILANAASNSFKIARVYAWNECDEGGCVMPIYNPANTEAPNTTLLDAWAAVNF